MKSTPFSVHSLVRPLGVADCRLTLKHGQHSSDKFVKCELK